MINKIKLYLDTLKRLHLKQSIFLIREKILKKVIPLKISSLNEIKSNLDIDKQVVNLEKNLNRLRFGDRKKSIWDLGISQNDFKHYYHSFVYDKLQEYKLTEDSDILNKLWETTHDDIEFIYNLQRMYKFSEAMNSLEFNDIQKLSVIRFWIEKFPPQKGVSWMGFNCSIRLINWVKILAGLETFETVDKEYIRIISLSMLQNIEFIEKNIEHHIPGNHVIFQYFALWLVTFLFEDERKEKFARIFEKEFITEFHESGLHFELSTHYHLQVLQLGVYYLLINYENNHVPKLFFDKIKKAFYVLDAFSFKQNNLPLIGDNCYNFFHNNLVEDSENLNYLRKLLEIDESKESDITEIKNEYLIAEKNKFKVIFDVGNIGMPQNPGHGHSDILSINFSYDGVPIFVDPGTRRYSNLPENLNLKRTFSHNTVSINGEDQAKLWGFFRWAFLPRPNVYHYYKKENSVTLEGNLNGFKNIGGAVHTRKIILNNQSLVIYDEIVCKVLKRIEQNFILSEQINVNQNNGKYYLTTDDHKFEFIIKTDESYKVEIVPQKIYKSYDNPENSEKIRIVYNTSSTKFETKIVLVLVNE